MGSHADSKDLASGPRPEAHRDQLGPWLTADQAVEYLGLPSRKALYQSVRRGQVPAHRLGERRLRFHRDELDQILLQVPAPMRDKKEVPGE